LTPPAGWRIFFVDTMRIRLQRWGNSLAVRIPAAFARTLGVEQNSQVDLRMTKSALTITPVPRPKPWIDDLLSRITADNTHGEVGTGKPQGRETW
jgi:antitoxin MazE